MGTMSISETGIMSDDSSAPEGEQTDLAEISEISERGPFDEDDPGPGRGNAWARTDLPADRYLDREQSWVLFNQRVLELAEDDQTPLLERVRFLAIFASNLDEFFMVRVAGLMRRMAAGF